VHINIEYSCDSGVTMRPRWSLAAGRWPTIPSQERSLMSGGWWYSQGAGWCLVGSWVLVLDPWA
jgi:hypothetical protein